MRIGIRTGCLKLPWFEAMEAAAALGFDSVEPDIGVDFATTPLWNAADRQRLAAAVQASKCTLESICVGALWKISPASADEQVRRQAVELMKSTATYAAEIGTRWILLPVTPGGENLDYDTSVQRWIGALREAAPAAEKAGVLFCVENVGRGCGKSAAELLRLIDGARSAAVRAYYDIGNAIAFKNDPVAEIAQLGGALAIVHVKDHAPLLGQGDVPVPACLRALVRAGYNDDLIFETRLRQGRAGNSGHLTPMHVQACGLLVPWVPDKGACRPRVAARQPISDARLRRPPAKRAVADRCRSGFSRRGITPCGFGPPCCS
jgi:sugar phosphate isomerase/epimerase